MMLGSAVRKPPGMMTASPWFVLLPSVMGPKAKDHSRTTPSRRSLRMAVMGERVRSDAVTVTMPTSMSAMKGAPSTSPISSRPNSNTISRLSRSMVASDVRALVQPASASWGAALVENACPLWWWWMTTPPVRAGSTTVPALLMSVST